MEREIRSKTQCRKSTEVDGRVIIVLYFVVLYIEENQ